MEIKALVNDVKCRCENVVRTTWDESRKCFRYTATFVETGGNTDNIFLSSDMFRKDYRIPLRDEVLRKQNLGQAASEDDDDEKLKTWDNYVSAQFVGKECVIHTCTLSVAQLTDGKFTSYVLQIGETSYEVASRTISAIGDIEAAVGRVSNQVLRACKEQEGEGE